MTDNDLIERLWDKRSEDQVMSRDEIAQALRPRVARGSRTMKVHLWTYVAVLLVTLVVQGVNVAGYWPNATMRALQIALTLGALGRAVFAVHMVGAVWGLDRTDEPLAETVERRLAFLRGKYEVWLWASAASLLLLIWGLNTLVDNAQAEFRINKPLVFCAVQVVAFLLTYGVLKVAHMPVVRVLLAVLEDLEAQIVDRTNAARDWERTARRWKWAVLAVCIALLALGVWKALHGL